MAGILVATLLVGPILDLIGAKPILAVALLLIAASLAVMSALDSYSGLAASAFTYGLGGGLLNTAANALVAELSAGGRASALNLLGFFFSLGAILAPMTLSSLGGSFSVTVVLRGLVILCLLILGLVLALRFPSGTRLGTGLRSLLGAGLPGYSASVAISVQNSISAMSFSCRIKVARSSAVSACRVFSSALRRCRMRTWWYFSPFGVR